MKHLALAVCLTLSTLNATHAFDASDRKAAEDTVSSFLADFEAGNWQVLALPPGVINFVANQQGVAPAQVRTAMIAQSEDIMKRVEILGTKVDWDNIQTGTLETGQSYAFLRMRLEMSVDSGPMQATDSLNIVAEIDDGWYFVRIATKSTWDIFRAAYPEFADVSLPK